MSFDTIVPIMLFNRHINLGYLSVTILCVFLVENVTLLAALRQKFFSSWVCANKLWYFTIFVPVVYLYQQYICTLPLFHQTNSKIYCVYHQEHPLDLAVVLASIFLELYFIGSPGECGVNGDGTVFLSGCYGMCAVHE
jgi:hypothetical protein